MGLDGSKSPASKQVKSYFANEAQMPMESCRWLSTLPHVS